MVSAKALAAIGLTLIIIVPIGMGYILSIEEEESLSWQTTTESRITELLQNNITPYYGSYKGTSNNSALFDGGAIVAPSYITTTSTYTSLPIYTTTYESYNVDTVSSTISGTIDSSTIDASYVGVHLQNVQFSGPGEIVAGLNYYNIPEYAPSISVSIDAVKTSASTWHVEYDSSGTTYTYDNVSSWYFSGIGAGSSVTYDRMVTIPYDGAYSAYFPSATVQVNDSWYYGAITLAVVGNTVTVDGVSTTYDSEPTVKVRSDSDFSIQKTVTTGTYADPADGWTLPASNTVYSWLNNQVNDSVTLYALIPEGQDLILNSDLTVSNVSGTIYVQYDDAPVALGSYSRVMIVASDTAYIVGGLGAWPSMGTAATVYNSLDFVRDVPDFRMLDLEISDTSVALRVDNANVVAGTFPTTLDLTFNLNGVFPGASIDIYFNSVGIYGDYLTFAGVNYPVNPDNGSITVNGQAVRVLKSHFSAWYIDDHYSVRINGVEIAQTVALPDLVFGGEWVISAIAYKLEEVPQTVMVWEAGKFALDKESFGAVAMLVCLACLIVLGMTGGRSMSKMGLLLLVCGGAALVIFIFI